MGKTADRVKPGPVRWAGPSFTCQAGFILQRPKTVMCAMGEVPGVEGGYLPLPMKGIGGHFPLLKQEGYIAVSNRRNLKIYKKTN